MKQIKPLLIIFLMIFLFLSQGSGQEDIRNDLPEGVRACIGNEKINRIIRDIAYSPDGTQFAVATSKGIWLYDTDTYQIRFQLTEHSGEVYTLAFSPDGQILASGGQDKTIRLWNPHTGKNITVFRGHSNGIAYLYFSIDGLTLTSMSWRDGELRVWNVKTGQTESTLVDMPPDAYPIAISPDVQTLAIREKNGTIQLWDTKTAEYKTTLTGHKWEIDSWWAYNDELPEPGGINCVAFSPDSKILASGSDDSTIRLRDTKKGKHKATLLGHQAWVYSITFSPDGNTIASGDGILPGWRFPMFFYSIREDPNNREDPYESQDPTWRFLRFSHPNYGDSEPDIRVWDAKTGKHRTTIQIPITAKLLEFAPDNETLASVDFDSVIRIWDTKTGKQKAFLTDHKPGMYAIFTHRSPIVSPDGGKVIYLNKDRSIQMWDTTNGKQTTLLKDNLYPIGFLVFSPDCETIAISDRHNRVIQLWNLKTDRRKAIFTGDMHWGYGNYDNPTYAFPPDSRYAAFASEKMVRLFNTKTGKQIAILTTASDRPILKFSPNSKTIATRGQDEDMVQLWNTETGHAKVLLITTQRNTSSVVFSPDGKYLISETSGNPSALWRVETGKQIINFRELRQYFTSLIFSPDGKTIAGIISHRGKIERKTIWLLNTETGKHKMTITTPIEVFEQILFSPDGATLVSEGQDATIRLWDTITGKHKTAITEHVGGIEKILFSSDSATLVSEGRDATIRLWDTITGQQKATLTEFTAKAPIVLSPDGKMLANGGKGSAVHLSNLETGKLITTFTGYEPVKKIVFAKDGKTLITIENDGTTLLWDLPQ